MKWFILTRSLHVLQMYYIHTADVMLQLQHYVILTLIPGSPGGPLFPAFPVSPYQKHSQPLLFISNVKVSGSS